MAERSAGEMRKNRGRYILIGAAVCLLAVMLAGAAAGETAEELQPLRLDPEVKAGALKNLFDGSYFTNWYAKKGWVQIDLKEGEAAYGIYLCFQKEAIPVVIQIPGETGEYRDWHTLEGKYLHEFAELPGVTSLRIRIADESKKEMLTLTEIHLFGPGETPEWVQRWRTAEKADLMLLCGHPDDDLLWFGGALPVYAGEKGMHVQVVYLARGDAWRNNELLDGLWMCGVRDYPIVSPFHDLRSTDRGEVMRAWGGKNKFYAWFTGILRQTKPEVLITQDVKGEYGHGVHKAASRAAMECPELAADPDYEPETAEECGVWQVKKVYIHLYEENQIRMDWEQPLHAFGGKTGVEMANEALNCHKSQQPIGYEAKTSGIFDCTLFGLYSSTVGPDEEKNDFFEHIEQ